MDIAKPPVVTAAEWEAALAGLTSQEEAVAAELDKLTAARKRMPMVRVEGDHRFHGPRGGYHWSTCSKGATS